MKSQITSIGIDLLQTTEDMSQLKLGQFVLGSAFNYIPEPTETNIRGDVIWAGSSAGPEVATANLIKYTTYVDNSVGDFYWGEFGLFTKTGELFALSTSDSLIKKFKQGQGTNGNDLRIDIFISMVGADYTMWLDVADSSDNFQVSSVRSVDALAPSRGSNPNIFVVQPTPNQSAFLAYTDRLGLWSFDQYQFNPENSEVLKYPVVSSSTFYVSVKAIHYHEDNPAYFGEKILQFTTGVNYSICRNILSVVPGPDGTVVLQFRTPLAIRPSVGDKFVVLSRIKGVDESTPAPDVKEPVNATLVDIPRFKADCWTVNGPRSAMFCITADEDSFTLTFKSTRQSDLVAGIWNSQDLMEHRQLSYNTNTDYSNCILEFDYTVDGDVADIDDEHLGASLTLTTNDEVSYFVRLSNYQLSGDNRSGRFRIDFDQVKGGFDNDEEIQVTDIKELLFSAVTTGYDALVSDPLPEPQSGTLTVSNMVVSGTNSSLQLGILNSAPHQIGMCTGYDDQYNFSPKRIVDCIYMMGCRGPINHYCGMSHYYDQVLDTDENRFKVTTVGKKLNPAATKWHSNFLANAKSRQMNVILAISYELFSEVCPYEWTQRQWDDSFAITGYSPPSFLLSPCVEPAMDWLKSVFLEFASLADEQGLDPWLQVGEPWWWFNTEGSKPCFYDYQTKVKFNNDTGLFAPEFPTINSTELVGTPYDEFMAWLRETLGESVLSIRDAVKGVYPKSKTSALVFLPSILDPSVGIINEINYPQEHYSYPNLDFIQTEAYDWLIDHDLNKSMRAFSLATEELGYPNYLVHYLAGFVPDNDLGNIIKPGYDLDTDGKKIWQYIFGSMFYGQKYGLGKQYIWSFPQAMRDSLVFNQSAELKYFYLDSIPVSSALYENTV